MNDLFEVVEHSWADEVSGQGDVELLSLILNDASHSQGIGEPYSRCNTAQNLLKKAGSLRNLLSEPEQYFNVAEVQRIYGLKELFSRFLEQKLEREPALTSPELTRNFLMAKLRDLKHEVFSLLYLDNQHRVIKYEELFRGTIDGAAVYPREVVKKALANNAAAVILVHNHPSGIAEPSHADRAITERLKKALELVDIRTLDHLIVGDGYCDSFAERGWL